MHTYLAKCELCIIEYDIKSNALGAINPRSELIKLKHRDVSRTSESQRLVLFSCLQHTFISGSPAPHFVFDKRLLGRINISQKVLL